MPRLPQRFRPWFALAGVAACVAWPAASPASITDPARFLDQTESLRTRDHPRFLAQLRQIHREAPNLHLGQLEQWHLRYLDAWETLYEGDYAKSAEQLRDVVAQTDDPALSTKAASLLLLNLGSSRRYEEGFELANRLVAGLPKVHDPQARSQLLMNLSQMMSLGGQADLAIKYARMMEDALPAGESPCLPRAIRATALYDDKRLKSSSPELHDAIDTCIDARQPVAANALWLVMVRLLLDEGHPDKAMALLDRIEPGIRRTRYYPHLLSSLAERAQVLAALGNDDGAGKAALAAVAMRKPGDINEWLKDAYEVLYQVAERQGHAGAALAYYKLYTAQDKGYLDGVGARALAYETVQQHLLAQQLEAEKLGRQNSVLQLRQALADKTIETGRLYIALLLLALASVALWLFRLKRSQLRFKKLAHHDGLTGILNHQCFVGDARRVLHLLEKRHLHACLIAIDLDHFKRINDTHGHATGDAVLKHAAEIGQQHLRPGDLFGRLGGEEFAILLHDCGREGGMAIAERIRRALQDAPVEGDGCLVTFSASVGLASTETFGYGLQRLQREADAALYRAKRTGRNRLIADAEDGSLVEA